MKTLRLYGKHWDKFAIFDDKYFENFSKINWFGVDCHHCDNVYVRAKVNGKVIGMHNLVMGTPSRVSVDHINHNSLDNREENLRICTASQNALNTLLSKKNKSGYKGVCWHKASKKFTAQIQVLGKRTCLGFFDNPRHAALAYDLWAKDMYGDFAYTNFQSV